MTKTQKQTQKLLNHKMLIARLDLEKATSKSISKKTLKSLARYYKHSYRDTLITSKRVGLAIR